MSVIRDTIEMQWTEAQPGFVREMKREGRFEKLLDDAAILAYNQQKALMDSDPKMQPGQAMELVYPDIFLPQSMEDQEGQEGMNLQTQDPLNLEE